MDRRQAEIAWQIKEQVSELAKRATDADLPELAYLLDCCRVEADNIIEQAGGVEEH